jgi:hypothetical protein
MIVCCAVTTVRTSAHLLLTGIAAVHVFSAAVGTCTLCVAHQSKFSCDVNQQLAFSTTLAVSHWHAAVVMQAWQTRALLRV